MRVTIVYESMFGNTETLADAVAAGMRDQGAVVEVLRAGDARDHDLRDVDLLVLAAPTHALSLSRASTRADAVEQGADAANAATGIREWLAGVEAAAGTRERPPVAVFDTRARIARHWPGAAARSTSRGLRRQGFSVVDRASFYVDDVTGPLLEGEVERARIWGHHVASVAATAADA